mmetsp:Transcript_9104/g.26114  ORF Transcript_9104/g.26114 Transcript_9104/m.26114 type:complete len:308 (-) Transcript_9104:82-1005(-)
MTPSLIANLQEFSQGLRLAGANGMVLINSFRGLESPGLIPTNWTLTGPLLPPLGELQASMASNHPELSSWMDAAADAGHPLVYVSMGSLVKLIQWEVETLSVGLELAGCKVVWSLPEESQKFLPPLCNKDNGFWVSSWLPQPAILSHRATKACISHCGWGGLLENIAAGIPMLALPFAADQPVNARLLVQAGAALMLPNKAPIKPMGHSYKKGDFTSEGVASSIRRLLTEPRFTEAVKDLRAQAIFEGGRKKAGDCIEWMGSCRSAKRYLDNPMVRSLQGHRTEFFLLPVLCTGAVAAALLVLRSWR